MIQTSEVISHRTMAVRLVPGVIAADFDGTLCSAYDDSGAAFAKTVAPQLVKAASLGAHVAVISGSSVERLAPRLIAPLVSELCRQHALPLLNRFLFAFNTGGVLARASLSDLAALLEHPYNDAQPTRVLDWLCPLDSAGRRTLRPQVVSSEHINRCRLEPDPDRRMQTEATVEHILRDVGQSYFADLLTHPALRSSSDLTLVSDDNGRLTPPRIDIRRISHAEDSSPAVMQMTLRPLLTNGLRALPAEHTVADPRAQATAEIQRRLNEAGLGHIAAREAGRSSIDVAPRNIDKAVAMRSVLDVLDVSAAESCYLGNEVFAGNDRALMTVPGLTVVAVGGCGDHPSPPPLASIVQPPPTLSGPRASTHVLQTFIDVAEGEIHCATAATGSQAPRSAIALMLEKLLGTTNGRSDDASSPCWRRTRPDPPTSRRAGARVRIATPRQRTLPRQRAADLTASTVLSQTAPKAPARAPPTGRTL